MCVPYLIQLVIKTDQWYMFRQKAGNNRIIPLPFICLELSVDLVD